MDQFSNDIKASIERSSVRKKILLYLYRSSMPTMYDIAMDTKTAYTNATGAIAGCGKRYGKERSLIYLGLVQMEKGVRGLNVYSLTSEGRRLADVLDR
jgi:predicted transcriptional regulator with HTH domain